MAKPSRSQKTTQQRQSVPTRAPDRSTNPLFSPVILGSIITGIVTITVAVIANLPQILALSTNKPAPTAADPTIIVITATAAPTNTPSPMPTRDLTGTLATTQATSSSATVPFPSLSCLDGWQIVSTDPSLQVFAEAQGTCSQANIPALGMATSQGQLHFGLSGFVSVGSFGISARIPPNPDFNVKVEEVSQAPHQDSEFWLAVSNDPVPENRTMIFAFQPQKGEIRQYLNQAGKFSSRWAWNQLWIDPLPGPPYEYYFRFSITGNSLKTQINDLTILSSAPQVVNSPKYLFIGFHNRSSTNPVQMQFNVSGLKADTGD
jgi:hypothetical protein